MAERDPYAPSAVTLAGDNADIYFRRSCDILATEQLNPVVAMEVFTRRRALLCGLREAQALLRQVLGEEAEVWSLDEGDWIESREVVLRIPRSLPAVRPVRDGAVGNAQQRDGVGHGPRRSAWPQPTECRLSASALGISTRRSVPGWNTRPSSGDASDAPLRKGPLSPTLRQPGPCPTP